MATPSEASGSTDEFDPEGDIVIRLALAEYDSRDRRALEAEEYGGSDMIVSEDSLSGNTSSVASIIHVPAISTDEGSPAGQKSLTGIVQFRCSSNHLRLASTYFNRMLRVPLSELAELHASGSAYVDFTDFSATAMRHLLNIIHGHTRAAPRTVSLAELTDIAIIVDYLGCHESVEVFTDMWIAALKGNLPNTFSLDVMRWICIASVFRKPALFTYFAKIA